YFAEPVHSPCMTLGMMSGCHDKVSVQDFGIDNITAADGLAVGRASGFVGKLLENLISGAYTVSDENLFKMLTLMYDSENIKLEPSALAGVIGPLSVKSEGTHIAWTTGGDMVPEDIYKEDYRKGKNLIESQKKTSRGLSLSDLISRFRRPNVKFHDPVLNTHFSLLH